MVRQHLQAPSLQLKLRAARMAYAARIYRKAPDLLHLLIDLQASDPWLDALLADLSHLRAVMDKQLSELPCPYQDLRPWARLWIASPKPWTNIIKRYVATAVKLDGSIQVESTHAEEMVSSFDDASHFCYNCDRGFSTYAALRAHQFSAHGMVRWQRSYIRGTVCPGCRKDFMSRPRILAHLARSLRCSDSIDTSEPLPSDQLRDIEQSSRAMVRELCALGYESAAALRPCGRPSPAPFAQ